MLFREWAPASLAWPGTGPPELAWAQPDPWLGNVGFQGLGVLPKIPWLPPPTHPSRDSDPSQSRVQIDVLGWDTACWWSSCRESKVCWRQTAVREGAET